MHPARPRESQSRYISELNFRPQEQVPIYDTNPLPRMNLRDITGHASTPPVAEQRSQPVMYSENFQQPAGQFYLMYVQFPGSPPQPCVPLQAYQPTAVYYPQPYSFHYGPPLVGTVSPWSVTFPETPGGNSQQLPPQTVLHQPNPPPAPTLAGPNTSPPTVQKKSETPLACPNCHHQFSYSPATKTTDFAQKRTEQGVQTSPCKGNRYSAEKRRKSRSESERLRTFRRISNSEEKLPPSDHSDYLKWMFHRKLFRGFRFNSKKRDTKTFTSITTLLRSFWNERYLSPPMPFIYVSKKYYDRIEAWEMNAKYELTHERISSKKAPPWSPSGGGVSAEGRPEPYDTSDIGELT